MGNMGNHLSQILVPVYRLYKPTWDSPCLLWALCPTCSKHQKCVLPEFRCRPCRRGTPYECERMVPAMPAYVVSVREALAMVNNGEAMFVHRNNAIQLTYPKPKNLRDLSCDIDPKVMFDYALRVRRARIAVDLGWQAPPEIAAAALNQYASAVLGFALWYSALPDGTRLRLMVLGFA